MTPNEVDTFGVEQLLRDAAAWEPDQPAPVDLATRVLAMEQDLRREQQTRRAREVRTGLFGGIFLGASAISATVALAFMHLRPEPVRNAVQQAEMPQVAGLTRAVKPSPMLETPPDHIRSPHRRLRRQHARPVGLNRRLRRAVRSAEPPVAVWHEESVKKELASVLAAGWLVERDPSDGSFILTPAVLDVPVMPSSQEACESIAPMPAAPSVPPPPAPEGSCDAAAPPASSPVSPAAASPGE